MNVAGRMCHGELHLKSLQLPESGVLILSLWTGLLFPDYWVRWRVDPCWVECGRSSFYCGVVFPSFNLFLAVCWLVWQLKGDLPAGIGLQGGW